MYHFSPDDDWSMYRFKPSLDLEKGIWYWICNRTRRSSELSSRSIFLRLSYSSMKFIRLLYNTGSLSSKERSNFGSSAPLPAPSLFLSTPTTMSSDIQMREAFAKLRKIYLKSSLANLLKFLIVNVIYVCPKYDSSFPKASTTSYSTSFTSFYLYSASIWVVKWPWFMACGLFWSVYIGVLLSLLSIFIYLRAICFMILVDF